MNYNKNLIYVKDQTIEVNNFNRILCATIVPSIETQIFELKQNLLNTDYIACKIAEGAATKEEYKDILMQRQLWREEINRLTKERDN